ncbi:5579_t:CDS:1 [Paraglomus brasilianum]|uniref:5579_t:CDS:1 n=1 Tax=Paraglomus brasilianum TaxID=144538 RepID=A0A9N9C254_9GLOM|nr:5579_t:CDS:1 [Paraglomus brasilianum]
MAMNNIWKISVTKRAYDADVRGLMNQYGVMTEYEVVSGFIVNSTIKVEQVKYRERSVNDDRYYCKKFGRTSLPNISSRGKNQMGIKSRLEAKAYAWYHVAYHPCERGMTLLTI